MTDLGLKPAVASATINKTKDAGPNGPGSTPKEIVSKVKTGGASGMEANLAAAVKEINRT